MRFLWELFTLLVALGVLFGLAKGFPAFGRVLVFLIANPLGLLLTAGVIGLIVFARRRRPDSDPNGDRR